MPDPELVAEVLQGLAAKSKSLSPRFFYDARGSELFDAITQLPEYYLTRTELGILARYGGEMAACIGPRAAVVELGIGSPQKACRLLEHLPDLGLYVPIDISPTALARAVATLRRHFPDLPLHPVCGDFTKPLVVPGLAEAPRRVLFYPGSTIGNLDPDSAGTFLQTLRLAHLGPGDGLLIGVDLQKDPELLEPAYDDAQGVTAAFNKNLLTHLNRLVDADFDPERFEHVACYNADLGRIEMHLRSLESQQVRVAGHTVAFAKGETLHTESSWKYTRARLDDLCRRAGFTPGRFWTDERQWFAVAYCQVGA